MRPEILNPLFRPVAALPGVGEKIAPLIERLAGPHVIDLLWHLPSGVIDRRYTPWLTEAEPGGVATLLVRIDRIDAPSGRGKPWKVRCSDDAGGKLDLVFFHAGRRWLEKRLPAGRMRVVSGRLEIWSGRLQMVHPDAIGGQAEFEAIARVEPSYPLTTGLQPRILGKALAAALEMAPDLPEWLDPALQRREGWPEWKTALTRLHTPQDIADLEPDRPARRRLAYDELLSGQLALALIRRYSRQRGGRTLTGDGHLVDAALDALPFPLTGSQRQAIAEITAEMAAPQRMMRLLQGDVGSGKTVVALVAMLTAVEAGHQAILMAPTEILARQHAATLAPWLAAAGIEAVVLTGRDKGEAREQALAAIARGDKPVIIGTHALFQKSVEFADPGVIVIDEQHRFGVHERLALSEKGRRADMLVMTATPIPRTLTLTAYGDMEVSRLTEKPPGRQPVETRILPLTRAGELAERLHRRAGETGERAFWVCPLVAESEASDRAAAEARRDALKGLFGDRVGLVHGRMRGEEKDAVMAAFKAGALDVLVATTVIEVGVDVPEATIMIIEQAERFGLAQLHQLRGRVGRGARPASCLLLYDQPLSDTARRRLETLRQTQDGFEIAETDLALRGAGEVLGTRQSGLPETRLADLAEHADLLELARKDAAYVLGQDPELTGVRGRALRVLLYLFQRDTAVRYLGSG